MNKKYDEDFFDDLDKTTDLLKAFKPHIENSKNNNSDDLADLFNEYNNDKKSSQKIEKSMVDELTMSIKPIRSMKEAEELETSLKRQKEEQRLQKERELELQRQQELLQIKKQQELLQAEKELSSIFLSQQQEQRNSKKQNQQKTDLNEIIDKMSETVEIQKKEKISKQRKQEIKKAKKSEKRSVKFSKFEKVFCALSFIFIIGCIFVFGMDSNKNDNSDNNPIMSLSTAISRTTPVYSGDGLYINSGEYIYKGKNVDNYLYYSNMIWRIIKTNEDGTIDLVLDDSINTLSWASVQKTYLESDIHKYLNEYFLKYLDTTYLEKVEICNDKVNNLKSFTCENKNNDYYVRLLTLKEFNDSKTDGTYITNEKKSLWLSTMSDSKVWHINGNNATLTQSSHILGVKPVIKLKSEPNVLSGNGTKEEPYMITEKETGIHVGEYIKLDNDIYIVYDVKDNKLNLVLDKLLPVKQKYNASTAMYDTTTKGNLGYYLNNDYYNSLTYKNLLQNNEWYVGTYYNSYEDAYKTKIVAKVGIYDIPSLKFDNELQEYFLSNGINGNSNILVYSNETYGTLPTDTKYVRPTISIIKNNVSTGEGTKENPYILEK